MPNAAVMLPADFDLARFVRDGGTYVHGAAQAPSPAGGTNRSAASNRHSPVPSPPPKWPKSPMRGRLLHPPHRRIAGEIPPGFRDIPHRLSLRRQPEQRAGRHVLSDRSPHPDRRAWRQRLLDVCPAVRLRSQVPGPQRELLGTSGRGPGDMGIWRARNALQKGVDAVKQG